jgi:hypothetical protein
LNGRPRQSAPRFLNAHDYTWAWKVNISATDPTAFENLTQYDNTPQFWYLTK